MDFISYNALISSFESFDVEHIGMKKTDAS